MSTVLFFVRVNQVLVRLWMRATVVGAVRRRFAVFLAIDD
jgi:hypothetical protein